MFTETPEIEALEPRGSISLLKEEIINLIISKECLDSNQKSELFLDIQKLPEVEDQFTFVKSLGYGISPKQKNYIPKERIQLTNTEDMLSFIYLNHLGVKMNDILNERDFCEPIEKIIPVVILLNKFNISLTNAIRFHPELFEMNINQCFKYLEQQQNVAPISQATQELLVTFEDNNNDTKLPDKVQEQLFKALFETKISLNSEKLLMPFRNILIDILSRHNQRLVHYWIHRIYYPDTDQNDLNDALMVGTRGLLLAINKFDPRIGVRFSTYAAFWIRLEIRRQKRDMENLISISDDESIKLSYLGQEIESEYQKLGTTTISISKAIENLTQKENSITPQTLQRAYEIQGIEITTVDDIAEERKIRTHEEPIERQALNHVAIQEIYALAKKELSIREFEIFSLLYPTELETVPKTQEEIGQIYGFTRSNAGLILKTIRQKLTPLLVPWYEDYK